MAANESANWKTGGGIPPWLAGRKAAPSVSKVEPTLVDREAREIDAPHVTRRSEAEADADEGGESDESEEAEEAEDGEEEVPVRRATRGKSMDDALSGAGKWVQKNAGPLLVGAGVIAVFWIAIRSRSRTAPRYYAGSVFDESPYGSPDWW